MTLTIGVDVGGTKVAAGVVDERGKIIESLRRRTPAASPAQTEQAIADVVSELLSRHQATAAGIGAAGFVAHTRDSVEFAPNLAWRREPLSTEIRRRYREPLYHTVLERYIQLITRNGVTQGIFPEGGLTTDGALRPAKIGLLDYVLGMSGAGFKFLNPKATGQCGCGSSFAV